MSYSSGSAVAETLNPPDLAVAATDPAVSPGTTYTRLEEISNETFRAFVGAVLSGLEQQSLISKVALNFHRVALVGEDPDAAVVALPEDHISRLASPWITLSQSTTNADELNATVLWNERQILQDLAQLSGQMNGPFEPAMPLSQDKFFELSQLYADRALNTATPPTHATLLGTGLPADLLWLFDEAPQTTRGPFFGTAKAAMSNIAETTYECYAALVVRLIAENMATGAQGERIETLEDLKEIGDFTNCIQR